MSIEKLEKQKGVSAAPPLPVPSVAWSSCVYARD
jgi:hypothetical protein